VDARRHRGRDPVGLDQQGGKALAERLRRLAQSRAAPAKAVDCAPTLARASLPVTARLRAALRPLSWSSSAAARLDAREAVSTPVRRLSIRPAVAERHRRSSTGSRPVQVERLPEHGHHDHDHAPSSIQDSRRRA
jgi:hypothetical protein